VIAAAFETLRLWIAPRNGIRAITSQHSRAPLVVVLGADRVEGLGRLGIEPDPGEAALAQLDQGFREVAHHHERHVLEPARGGFGQHAGHRRRVPGRGDDGGDAEGRGRAHDGADIVRIGDLVEGEQHRVVGQRVEGGAGQGIGLEIEPLMHRIRPEQPGDGAGLDDLGSDAQLAHLLREAQRRILGREQPAELPLRVAERFRDRMPSVQHRQILAVVPRLVPEPATGSAAAEAALARSTLAGSTLALPALPTAHARRLPRRHPSSRPRSRLNPAPTRPSPRPPSSPSIRLPSRQNPTIAPLAPHRRPSSSGLGRRPFTAKTRVRVP
jgi:hypothetical protein